MNEPPDPLEAEFRAFSPVEVSPRLHRAIAERLAPPAPTASRRLMLITLATGSLAALILAVLVLGRGGSPTNSRPRIQPAPALPPVTAPSSPGWIAEPLPSLHAYNQAAARSTQALEALLDRHATRASGLDSPPVRIHAFNRPDRIDQTISGEL